MSNVVSFRCSDELEEFLEQEAEERMTTKSAAAQMLLAEKVQEMRSESGGNDASTGEDTSNAPLGQLADFTFDSLAEANAVRDEFDEYVASARGVSEGGDDARTKTVTLRAGTPADVVNEVLRRSN